MKKLATLLLLAASSFAVSAQKESAAQIIYDELEQRDDVFSISFNKKMLESIDTDVEWGDQMRYLKGDLMKVKVMLIDESQDAPKTVSYIKTKLHKLGYMLTRLPDDASTDKKDQVWLYTNKKGKHFTEAHFLVADEDGGAILFSVYGDITVTDEKL